MICLQLYCNPTSFSTSKELNSLKSMKFNKIFFIFIHTIQVLIIVSARDLNNGIMKIQKVSCSTSGKNVEKLYCRVKPVSRKIGHLNFGGYLMKPLRNIFGTYMLYHRPLLGGNYVRIIKIESINVCDMVKMGVSNMLFKYFTEMLNGTLLRGLVHECPYQIGWYRVENATMDVEVMNKWNFMQEYPNGEYRADIKIFNKLDDNIGALSVFYHVNLRDNALQSYDKM